MRTNYPDGTPTTAAAAPLMTVAELAAFYGVATPVAEPLNGQMALVLNGISRLIRDYCGRQITRGDYSETWHTGDWGRMCADPYWTARMAGAGLPSLRVTEWPIHAVTSMEVGGVSADTGSLRIHQALGNFWLDPAIWPQNQNQSITLAYDGGFDPLPEDLRLVVVELARRQLMALGISITGGGGGAPGPIKGVTVGALRVDFAVQNAGGYDFSRSSGTPVTATGLAEYAPVLDLYSSIRRIAAMGA